MTSFADRYNRNNKVYTFDFPEKGTAIYTNLKELQKTYGDDRIYCVYAFYINEAGQYGPTASAAIGKNMFVNLPGFMVDQIKEMRADGELTDAINAGAFGFRIIDRKSRAGKVYLMPEWVDIPVDSRDTF